MDKNEKNIFQVILTAKGLNTKLGESLIGSALSNLHRPVEEDTILLIVPDDYPNAIKECIKEACKSIGFVEKNIYFSYDEGVRSDFVASCVYISEGNTHEVLDYIRKNGLVERVLECLENGGMYIGSSAGAMIAGRSISLAKDFDSNYIGMVDFCGLGLLEDIEVVPHYTYEQLQNYVSSFGYTGRNIINVANNEVLIFGVEMCDGKTSIIKKKRIRKSED